MKSVMNTCLFAAIVLAFGPSASIWAQNTLGRLEADIRQGSGQYVTPAAALPAGQRVYLGAVALDDLARGVRITSVRADSPAQHGGLMPQDLVIGAAGRRIHVLRDLTGILGAMNPGDTLKLDVIRGAQTVQLQVVLGATPNGAAPTAVPRLAERPSIPPPTGLGAGPTESIPPPPNEAMIPPAPAAATPPTAAATPHSLVEPPSGPALEVPQPVAPNGEQSQIEDLRRRVDQLEQRVKDLERELAQAKRQ